MKKSEEIRWGRSMITTCVMILLIVAASFCVIHCINEMEEAECFNRLYEEADDLAEDIEMYADSDREELKMLSAMIAEYDKLDSADLWDFLDSYTAVGMMSRIELLLPDDTVLVRLYDEILTIGKDVGVIDKIRSMKSYKELLLYITEENNIFR